LPENAGNKLYIIRIRSSILIVVAERLSMRNFYL